MRTPLIVLSAVTLLFAVGCSKKKSAPIQTGGYCSTTFMADLDAIAEEAGKYKHDPSLANVNSTVNKCDKFLATYGQTACNAKVGADVRAVSYSLHQPTCDSARAILANPDAQPDGTSVSTTHPIPTHPRPVPDRHPRRPVSQGEYEYGDNRLVVRLPHGGLKMRLLNSGNYEIVDSGTVRSIFSRKTPGVFCGFHSYSSDGIRPGTVYRHASALEQPSSLTNREMTWLSFESRDEGVFLDCWTDKGAGLRVRDLKRAFRGIFQISASN